ncbi:MAG: DUF3737 family protein [Bacteroides sp.]|nr:DUF3737 family protein [Bacteroidales bacterium]MBD5249732.1 DUF3737 family protein [Barnesiella sp.]MBD5252901.1 DUF3737 family protein [Barnesiella sp.]MBD5345133.1 DUF3737 family protein [Bacteroides sp.]MBD5368381.1 DUF3737 family protein [Bacteroides sp.]
MKLIKDTEFGGERPLFASSDLALENVTIHTGESALKQCRNIVARDCRFEGKYPFWHVDNFAIENCLFTPGARAALWYSRDLIMKDTVVEAPKMFRDMDHLTLQGVKIPDAQETLWHCRDIQLRDVEVANADYLFMHCDDIDIDRYTQHGNYSFQYCNRVTIRNAEIHSKDAFWNTNDVTIIDSTISGEYLGWHSRRLKLINCHISGTQPLCYCRDLVVENCTFDADCDLAFEDSSLDAVVTSHITSVKNPRTGSIKAKSIGEIIIDANVLAPADCKISTDEQL